MISTRIKLLVAIIMILIISVALFSFFLKTSAPDLSRVALVGDSITQITSYPSRLQTLLGSNSSVGNFGASGATVVLDSIQPYLFENISQEAREFQPTTVIILLGTNDARSDVYPYIDRFVDDYKLLISKFQALQSKPQIFLVIPPPIYTNNINISSSDFTSGVIPRIEQVAKEIGLPLIDCYTPMLDHPDYFVDGVHPDDDGAQVIADTVYKQIKK